MNVIAWLEYELAYYDSAVHRFNHYTKRTPPQDLDKGYSSKFTNLSNSPVGLGCRIHRLHFCRGGKDPPSNQCLEYDTKLIVKLPSWSFRECRAFLHCHYSQVHSDQEHEGLISGPNRISVLGVALNCIWLWSFGNLEYLFIAITLKTTLTRSGSTCEDCIYGSKRTFTILATI